MSTRYIPVLFAAAIMVPTFTWAIADRESSVEASGEIAQQVPVASGKPADQGMKIDIVNPSPRAIIVEVDAAKHCVHLLSGDAKPDDRTVRLNLKRDVVYKVFEIICTCHKMTFLQMSSSMHIATSFCPVRGFECVAVLPR